MSETMYKFSGLALFRAILTAAHLFSVLCILCTAIAHAFMSDAVLGTYMITGLLLIILYSFVEVK